MISKTKVDVLVVGAGLVGSFFANCVLRHSHLSCLLLEKQQAQFDANLLNVDNKTSLNQQRTLAISSAILTVLNKLSINVDPYLQEFTQIQVYSHNVANKIVFQNNKQLGGIIFNKTLLYLLRERIEEYLIFDQIDSLCFKNNTWIVNTSNNVTIEAKFLICADGAKSALLEKLQVKKIFTSYNQSTFCATVNNLKLAKSLWQFFRKQDILAFLPLKNDAFNILLSTSANSSFTNDEFINYVKSFHVKIDDFQLVSQIVKFELYKSYVETCTISNLAIIGDSAHTIHPLSGLGANMGFVDAMVALDLIINGDNLNTLIAKRRFYQQNLRLAVDSLKYLFAQNNVFLSYALSKGIDVVNHKIINNFFTDNASLKNQIPQRFL